MKQNTNYIFSFYAKCSSNGLVYAISTPDWSENLVANETHTTTDYERFTLTFNSGSQSSIVLRFSDFGGTHYIDDVDIRTGDDLLTNGSFEYSTVSPWSLDSVFASSTADKYSGYKSILLSGTNSSANMTQYVNVTPNTDYTFTFYAKSSTSGLWFGVSTANWITNLATGTSIGNNSWTKYSLSLNSGNNTMLLIRFSDLGGTHYIDDAEFT